MDISIRRSISFSPFPFGISTLAYMFFLWGCFEYVRGGRVFKKPPEFSFICFIHFRCVFDGSHAKSLLFLLSSCVALNSCVLACNSSMRYRLSTRALLLFSLPVGIDPPFPPSSPLHLEHFGDIQLFCSLHFRCVRGGCIFLGKFILFVPLFGCAQLYRLSTVLYYAGRTEGLKKVPCVKL